MIHLSRVLLLLRKGDPVSIQFVKLSTGEKVEANGIVCSSSNFQRRTCNIRFPESGETRTIRNITITEYNGREVYA